MAVGTNLYAPFDGVVRFRTAGNGGWTTTITASDPRLQGLVVELMHLSGAVGLSLGQSRTVREGEHVAESGGAKGHPGAGNSTGPHVHGHGILNGTRIPLTQAIAWANAQLIETTESKEQLMSASYLYAPAGAGKPARYCIVGLDVPGGSYVTTNVQEAEALGFVYGQQSGSRVGAPIREITQAQLDTAVALYARERARKVAEEKGTAGPGATQYTVQMTGTVQPK